MSSWRRDQAIPDPIVLPRDDDVTIDLDAPDPAEDRAAQYREWAERMRSKRAANQQRIRGATTTTEEPPSYWRAEDLFSESRRVADGEVRRPTDPLVQDLLAVLGLAGEPTAREIDRAFRRLAKEHHPDRHVDADDAVRDHHLDQMRRVNEAYTRLRQLQIT